MSVPVSVPFADDYLESGTYPGLTELIAHPSNGFLYGCYEGSSPAANGRIVKIDQGTFAQVTVANLPKPNPIDMHYDLGTDRFYVIYRDDTLTLHPITQIHPATLAMVEFASIEATLGPGSITGDGLKLYVVSFFDEPSYIFPIELPGGAQGSAMPVTGFTKINCLRFFGSKLYAESLTEGGESMTVLRISTAGVVEEASEPIQITGGAFPVDDMGDSSGDIWIGNKDTTGLIRKFSKSALTLLTKIATAQASRCTCVKRLGSFIWAAFENGRALRIDPVSMEKRNYTLSQGQGYHSEFTGNNDFIFTYNVSTSKIARYHISDVPPLAGELIWLKQIGGTASDFIQAMAVDSAGNIYAAGQFQGTCDFSGNLTGVAGVSKWTSAGVYDVFVAKYSSSGTHLWSARFGGTSSDVVKSITLDPSGNIFVAGSINGNGLIKLSSAGVLQWARVPEGLINSIASDSQGNIIATGVFAGGVDFGDGHTLVSSFSGQDCFLAKYNTSGTCLAAVTFANSGDREIGTSVLVDTRINPNTSQPYDTIYLGGWGDADINLGGTHFINDSYGSFGFLGKFTSSGSSFPHVWSRTVGLKLPGDLTAGFCRILAMTMDSNGDIALTGTWNYTARFNGAAITGISQTQAAYVAKYSGVDGHYLWAIPIKGDVSCTPYGIAVNASGGIVIAGTFNNNFNFGGVANSTHALTTRGSLDGFIAKYNSGTGTFSWVQQFGGTASDGAYAVGSFGSTIIAAGYFQGTANFGTVAALQPLTVAGSTDGFLMRLNS